MQGLMLLTIFVGHFDSFVVTGPSNVRRHHQVRLLVNRSLLWCRLCEHQDRFQSVMGWSDDHLHQFRIHGKRYGIARIGGIWFSEDPDSVRLMDLGLRVNERFVYEYDITDDWRHQIRVENILDYDPHKDYPLCISGRGNPPFETGNHNQTHGTMAFVYFSKKAKRLL